MPLKLITMDAFRAQDGAEQDVGVFQTLAGPPAAINEDAREIRYCFSDGSLDIAGDTIEPKGWKLDQFTRNPVALWAHMSWDPPIGKASGVGIERSRLMGTIRFASADEYPFADTIYRLAKGGYINAVSVGFMPDEWSFATDKNRPFGMDFKKQTLLEISLCPVPCNGNALQEARSAGIDTALVADWAQRVLDGEGKVLVPRYLLEETFRAAKTPRAVRIKYLAPDRSDVEQWQGASAKDLAIDASDAWDGPAAAARIFAAAGFDGDAPDSDAARRGFLIYDAANPALKTSYRLPFADIVGGELKAVAGGLRAAASRLLQTDAPQDVLATARTVVDEYEARMLADTPVVRVGRPISAMNEAKLREAMDHHQAASDCIKSVLDTNVGDDPPGVDMDGDVVCDPVMMDPMKDAAREERIREARIREAAALAIAAEAA